MFKNIRIWTTFVFSLFYSHWTWSFKQRSTLKASHTLWVALFLPFHTVWHSLACMRLCKAFYGKCLYIVQLISFWVGLHTLHCTVQVNVHRSPVKPFLFVSLSPQVRVCLMSHNDDIKSQCTWPTEKEAISDIRDTVFMVSPGDTFSAGQVRECQSSFLSPDASLASNADTAHSRTIISGEWSFSIALSPPLLPRPSFNKKNR